MSDAILRQAHTINFALQFVYWVATLIPNCVTWWCYGKWKTELAYQLNVYSLMGLSILAIYTDKWHKDLYIDFVFTMYKQQRLNLIAKKRW